ncbi:hypothetical protein GW17_00052814 [Ensete ventricosum]|nr:hypothetical protein GW17_00052814 [Ensete ventricosum]RZS06902.1 hypothetical protein BHM03_00037619 [Ensete ventricosum]
MAPTQSGMCRGPRPTPTRNQHLLSSLATSSSSPLVAPPSPSAAPVAIVIDSLAIAISLSRLLPVMPQPGFDYQWAFAIVATDVTSDSIAKCTQFVPYFSAVLSMTADLLFLPPRSLNCQRPLPYQFFTSLSNDSFSPTRRSSTNLLLPRRGHQGRRVCRADLIGAHPLYCTRPLPRTPLPRQNSLP